MASTKNKTAEETAAMLSKSMGYVVTGKAVRSWVRANVARFSSATHPGYDKHDYTPAEVSRIVAAWKAKGPRRAAQTRKASPRKATVKRTARKVTTVKTAAPSVASTD